MNDQELGRFISKIEFQNGWTGCWIWTGAKNNKGYGVMRVRVNGERKACTVHRLSYVHFNGHLGDLDCLHKCDTPLCCNPDHLFSGTAKDNVMDALRKGRMNQIIDEFTFLPITTWQRHTLRRNKLGLCRYCDSPSVHGTSVCQYHRTKYNNNRAEYRKLHGK